MKSLLVHLCYMSFYSALTSLYFKTVYSKKKKKKTQYSILNSIFSPTRYCNQPKLINLWAKHEPEQPNWLSQIQISPNYRNATPFPKVTKVHSTIGNYTIARTFLKIIHTASWLDQNYNNSPRLHKNYQNLLKTLQTYQIHQNLPKYLYNPKNC